jgi:hypothetical protein
MLNTTSVTSLSLRQNFVAFLDSFSFAPLALSRLAVHALPRTHERPSETPRAGGRTSAKVKNQFGGEGRGILPSEYTTPPPV